MCKKSTFSITLVVLLILGGRASADLIGWWTFDEGAGDIASDASGSANDGTLQGDPQWVPGIVGSGALAFDGVDDIVQVDEDPRMDLDAAMTIAAWVKLHSLNTYYFVLVKQPSGTAPDNYPGNYEFRVSPGTGVLQFGHQTSEGTDIVFYDSSSGITAGRWCRKRLADGHVRSPQR
jgi:hypothetical protein